MTSSLENFVISHPAFTLSHADYGLQCHVGRPVNIHTSPPQRLHNFVENDGTPDGTPYRFIIVGQLASFKIVEDSFGHFLSVNLGQLPPSSFFTEVFRRQLATLYKIEEEDGKNNSMHAQYPHWRSSKEHLVFKAYDVSNYSLSSADTGGFLLAIVELRCLDVGQGLATFARTYWIEALSLRMLSSHDPMDEEFIKRVLDVL